MAKSKNYRYKITCKNCRKFIKNKDEHKSCKSRLHTNLFLCGKCKEYKSYENFGRDKSKRYGIRYNCKKCRAKVGNGN